jgi:hypothetical protein
MTNFRRDHHCHHLLPTSGHKTSKDANSFWATSLLVCNPEAVKKNILASHQLARSSIFPATTGCFLCLFLYVVTALRDLPTIFELERSD